MNDPWIYTPPKLVPVAAPAYYAVPRPRQPRSSRLRMLGAMPEPSRAQRYAPGVAKLLVGALAALAAFWHGYSRNGRSIPWGIAWAGAGFWCPVVTLPFAWSQGYGRRV
jgi:hypothetical protein